MLRRALFSCLILAAALVPATAPRAQEAPVELKVMIFNVWLGGDQVNEAKVLEAIEASGADVVLLQEPMGNTERFADLLGWPYANARQHMIAKVPLYDATDLAEGGGDYALAELRPGRFVALANVHLDWTEYGPYAVRDGADLQTVMETELELRVSGIEYYLEALAPLAEGGMPVFVGGDYNSPSHLDWTEAAVGTKPHILFPVRWPASAVTEEYGYTDSYRAVHPDPVATPGVTWSTGYPAPYLWEGETQDRIDLLFAQNAEVLDSQLLAEAGAADGGIVVDPWPSDHHAVVSTFSVVPQPAPATLIQAEPRAVAQGEPVRLRYSVAGTPDGRLENGIFEILSAGTESGLGQALATARTNDTTDRMAVVEVSTLKLEPGTYEAALVDADAVEIGRGSFVVLPEGAKPAIATDKEAYAPGETIVARFAAFPGNRYDWVALYPADQPEPMDYWTSLYTGGLIEGELAFDEETTYGPLESGTYEFRLMRDDSYTAIAVSPPFKVRAE